MRKKLQITALAFSIAILSCIAPNSAHAYVSAYDYLNSYGTLGSSGNYNPRDSDATIALQQDASAQRRFDQQYSDYLNQHPTDSSGETFYASAGDNPNLIPEVSNNQGSDAGLYDGITPQLVNALTRLKTAQIQEDALKSLGISGESFHSGAPLLDPRMSQGYGMVPPPITGILVPDPQPMPTQTIVLAPTGMKSMIAISLVVLSIVLLIWKVYRDEKTAKVAIAHYEYI